LRGNKYGLAHTNEKFQNEKFEVLTPEIMKKFIVKYFIRGCLKKYFQRLKKNS